MRANNQFVTLDEQAPAINKSDVWDPSIADAVLQQNYDAPISVVDAPAENAENAGDHDAGEAEVEADELVSDAPPSTRACDETDVSASVVPPVTPSDRTSVRITRANKRRSESGGKRAVKRQRNNTGAVTNLDANDTDINARDWEDVADEQVDGINDFELGEYMVGASAQILLPADYYPSDKGRWMVEVVDRVGGDADDPGPVKVKVVVLTGPNKKQIGAVVELPVSHTAGPVDISLCRALLENFPKAKTPLDIY
eukprot:3211003-Rhodomonas_salina.1